MRPILLIMCLVISSCTLMIENRQKDKPEAMFTENEILDQLDFAFRTQYDYSLAPLPHGLKYMFFLDLEHGYCVTAGSSIHLYADSTRWAIVFEKSGYQNRGFSAEIELDYFGNCIDYPVDIYPEESYRTNAARVMVIDPSEFERIENKKGTEMETFELIDPDIKAIKVRDTTIAFDNDYRNYAKVGIDVRDYDNPQKLIGFEDLVRYLHETNRSLVSATQHDIRQHLPSDLPFLMTINEFYSGSAYDRSNPPSKQETYQLIASVLVTRNTKNWRPTKQPNNHWKNWESGNL